MRKRTYRHMEIEFGRFYTEIHLPWRAAPEPIEASYANGFLEPYPKSHHLSVTEKQPLEE